jgi:hypothetical protein
MGRLAQRPDVPGGNETAVPGRMTTTNDGMRGGLSTPTDRCTSARRRRRVASAALQIVCSDHCKVPNSRPPDASPRTGNPAASRWNIADSPGIKTQYAAGDIVAITGFTVAWAGTNVGRPSTNIDHRASDVLDHARVDEPTRTESCSGVHVGVGPGPGRRIYAPQITQRVAGEPRERCERRLGGPPQ